MEVSLVVFAVFTLCLVGCGLHSYFLGRRAGIEHAVDYLVDSGQLDVDDE